jgi:Zn-dependent M16 (insulinase) family peptidase
MSAKTSMCGSFELALSISNKDDACVSIPVQKYVSRLTGMRLYVCRIEGPVVEGYFTLATEALDDDGLPHTLEHLVFLGSEDYPYAGVLDILANKVYASGTNAWTDVDNTTYTLSTAEKQGFMQLLPIYLDHIFYPLLNESGYVTEVYHVNGDAEDAGVVYSEMQSVENEDENVVEKALHRAMYPNVDCGYRYETGGVMKNLRESTTHEKVRAYHKRMYRADNMAIVVAGQIEADELIEVLERFEKKMLDKKNSNELRLCGERPFSRPIEPLVSDVTEQVYFPCSDEANTNGIVSLAWRGPHISDLRELIALDVLLTYMTDSSISPCQAYFINNHSYCSKVCTGLSSTYLTCAN